MPDLTTSVFSPPVALSVLSLSFCLGKLCRHDFERSTGIMVFAVAFFVGIYTPFAAIWANAPYHALVQQHLITSNSHSNTLNLAKVIEKTACCHYLGAFVLLGLGWILARRGRFPNLIRQGWLARSFSKEDLLLGSLNFIGGAVWVALFVKLSAVQWLGYICGCFFVFLLIRSIRTQFSGLKQTLPETPLPPLSLPSSVIALVCLAIAWSMLPIWIRSVEQNRLTNGSEALLFLSIALTLWIVMRVVVREPKHLALAQLSEIARPVTRLAFWGGLGFTLGIMGLTLRGIAERELNVAPDVSTPFAFSVLAFKPLYWILMVPGAIGLAGGWFVPLLLPRQVRPAEHIFAAAQGGAVMAFTCFVVLVLFALTIATLTVNAMPSSTHTPQLHQWLVSGDWISLGLADLTWLAMFLVATSIVWASEAAIAVGILKLWQRIRPNVPWVIRRRHAS